MDKLGRTLVRAKEGAKELRNRAKELEKEAVALRHEADEIERLAELARLAA